MKKIKQIYLYLLITLLMLNGLLNNYIIYKNVNLGSKLFDVFLILGYVLAIILVLKKNEKINIFFIFNLFFGIAIIFIAFIKSITLSNIIVGLRNLFLYPMLWYIVYLLCDEESVPKIYLLICRFSFFICLFAIFQFVFHDYLPDKLLVIKNVQNFSIWGVSKYRANGLIGDMLTFGSFSILAYLMQFSYYFIYKKDNINIAVKYISLAVPVIANFLTFSRISIVGIFVVVLCTYFYISKSGVKKILFILSIFAIAYIFILFTDIGKSIIERFSNESLNNSSDEIRFTRYAIALNLMRENPIVGVGIGTQIGNSKRIVPDGYWLSTLLELGCPLFFYYISFFLYTAFDTFNRRNRNKSYFYISFVYSIMILYFIFCSFINSSLEVRVNICTIMIIYGLYKRSIENNQIN